MLRIGLTGGIAAGKSVAATRLAELGAVVVDSDRLARIAVAPGSAGLAAIAAEFGAGMLDAGGALDRRALGAVVFGDPAALSRLNAIVHPIVARLGQLADQEAGADDPDVVVVHDIPLLVETGQAGGFDLVLVIHTDEDVRLRRLMDGRGLTYDEALARIRSQATDEERLAAATTVLDGSGTVEDLRGQVDAFWRDRVRFGGDGAR